MQLSKYMAKAVQKASMVREMFYEGIRLKELHGESKVFDFSLGNPDLKPPERLKERLEALAAADDGSGHGYMPNSGYLATREAVARRLDQTIGRNMPEAITPDLVVMTVGAAGAMNVILKCILDPGSAVVCLAPYFMEYNFYIENHGGVVKVAQTDENFRPSPWLLAEAIDEKTRAVIVNTPNNPTGAVYTKKELLGLAEILERRSAHSGKPILLISDEPYRKICFEEEPASIFECYRDSVIVTSFSKDLSIAGERLGYLCLNPRMHETKELAEAASMANRILGFVNAPALFQRLLPQLLDTQVDAAIYKKRLDAMTKGLRSLGYDVPTSQGTFYLFPKSPIPDDKLFVSMLKDELVLAVPGSGFGRAGFFRLSLCMEEARLADSMPGFKRAMAKAMAAARKTRDGVL